MSAYVVFTRMKTIDQEELEKYWTGIQATMKGHPIEMLVAHGKHDVLEGDKHRKDGAIYHGLIVEGVS